MKAPLQEIDLELKLWNLGLDHNALSQVRSAARTAGVSLIVYVREQLGIQLGGEPKIQLPAIEKETESVFDGEVRSRAYDLAQSPGVVRYVDYFIRMEDQAADDFENHLNQAADDLAWKYRSHSSNLVDLRRLHGPNRWQLIFRVEPRWEATTLFRYVVRFVRVRRLDDISLFLTHLNSELGPSGHFVSYIRLHSSRQETRRAGSIPLFVVYKVPFDPLPKRSPGPAVVCEKVVQPHTQRSLRMAGTKEENAK